MQGRSSQTSLSLRQIRTVPLQPGWLHSSSESITQQFYITQACNLYTLAKFQIMYTSVASKQQPRSMSDPAVASSLAKKTIGLCRMMPRSCHLRYSAAQMQPTMRPLDHPAMQPLDHFHELQESSHDCWVCACSYYTFVPPTLRLHVYPTSLHMRACKV